MRLTVFAASGVWRSCGCCGCTEGQNGAAQGHQGQCDDVPYGCQDCNPAVGLRSKPLLCRQERSVSFPNLSVSIPNLSVSVPNMSVNIPNLSVTVPNLSVSIPYLSSPSRLLLLLMSLLAPTPGSKDPSSSHPACKQADFLLSIFLGYSFPLQLYEHVHRVQPLMRRHLGKRLQDSLLACSDHELLNRQFVFRNAIPTLEI